jgi:hypothetical protein
MNHVRHDRFCAIISSANPIPSSAISMADRRWPGRGRARIFAAPRAGTFGRAGWHDPEKWKPVFQRDHPNSEGSDGSSP